MEAASRPTRLYCLPSHCRMTMIAKAVFSTKGVQRVSFLPAYINSKAQPAVLSRSDPKFEEILDYMEWVSDQHAHRFTRDGDEIVVETSRLAGEFSPPGRKARRTTQRAGKGH